MELLDDENNRNATLEIIKNINQELTIRNIQSEDSIREITQILLLLLDEDDKELLLDKNTFVLVMLLENYISDDTSIILRNMITELKLKLIRLQTVPCYKSDSFGITRENNSCMGRERFVPTKENPFILPPEGEIGNLTSTEFDFDTGKKLIRELLVDSNGYVVAEQSRHYEDVYTDESESIYNQKYIDALKNMDQN